MRQSISALSIYASDVSGVCSALYELGGMIVMHDASGCNSTYNTHDEPRWYHSPAAVFISALSEMEAVLGGDDKLISDIIAAAKDLNPRFIAIAGTPIPMMMGTDFTGIARMIERRTGIPTMGFNTNGMRSYQTGVAMALAEVAERFCTQSEKATAQNVSRKPVINLLGVTPLDFSVTGNVEDMKILFENAGFEVHSIWAMQSDWESIITSSVADVNVVVSASGMGASKVLNQKFGTPYVVGTPIGKTLSEKICKDVLTAYTSGENIVSIGIKKDISNKEPVYVIGEEVWATSVRYALMSDFNMSNVHVIAPMLEECCFLNSADYENLSEKEIIEKFSDASMVIGDTVYNLAIKADSSAKFIDFPHEGYSGRTYRKNIPSFIGEKFNLWFEESIKR